MAKFKKDNDMVKDDDDLTSDDKPDGDILANGTNIEEKDEEENLDSWELESDLEE